MSDVECGRHEEASKARTGWKETEWNEAKKLRCFSGARAWRIGEQKKLVPLWVRGPSCPCSLIGLELIRVRQFARWFLRGSSALYVD